MACCVLDMFFFSFCDRPNFTECLISLAACCNADASTFGGYSLSLEGSALIPLTAVIANSRFERNMGGVSITSQAVSIKGSLFAQVALVWLVVAIINSYI